uniref:glutathione S-transferase n=1 Tax=Limnohabitans sp. TaxID=1907725 RepID=UPI003341508B
CPYAMRARLALLASGVVYEHREVALKAKPAEMLAVSPKGTVPVLVLPSGEVLDESLDIMRWALQQNDPQAWLPDTPKAWALTHDGIASNDGEFKAHLDRYKYPQRFGLSDGVQHRTQASSVLLQWQARLQIQGFLSGSQWGLLDACVAPFVRQFARTDRAWFDAQPWPELAQWLTIFENSEAFAAVMYKHPLWASP